MFQLNNTTTTSVTMSTINTRISLLALDVGNVFFLTFCCTLLIMKYLKRTHRDPQQLYLINLAASEIVANILLIVRDTANVIRPVNSKIPSPYHTVFWCLNMAYVSGVSYIYITARFYVTGDRLLHIVLHAKYAQHWTIRRTWKILAVTWFINIFISIGLALLTYFRFDYVRYEAKISRFFAVYILTVVYLLFSVFVVVAYTLMFLNHARSKRHTARKRSTVAPPSLYSIFTKSRFFISALLVLTYLVLTVIPSLTRAVYLIGGYKVPYPLTFAYLVSTRVSYTVDGVIYTFLQKCIRELLREKFVCTQEESESEMQTETYSIHASATVSLSRSPAAVIRGKLRALSRESIASYLSPT